MASSKPSPTKSPKDEDVEQQAMEIDDSNNPSQSLAGQRRDSVSASIDQEAVSEATEGPSDSLHTAMGENIPSDSSEVSTEYHTAPLDFPKKASFLKVPSETDEISSENMSTQDASSRVSTQGALLDEGCRGELNPLTRPKTLSKKVGEKGIIERFCKCVQACTCGAAKEPSPETVPLKVISIVEKCDAASVSSEAGVTVPSSGLSLGDNRSEAPSVSSEAGVTIPSSGLSLGDNRSDAPIVHASPGGRPASTRSTGNPRGNLSQSRDDSIDENIPSITDSPVPEDKSEESK